MWNYTTFYPYGKKNTFSLGGRLNEIFAYQNVHNHPNNYTVHKGFGTGNPPKDWYQVRALNSGHALQSLPLARHAHSPYIEAVWAAQGSPVGAARIIYNQHDLDEIYFTDDHYTVYWKVEAGESIHTFFDDDD